MEYVVLGWPPDGPKLRLDHERFAYAGKFVMTTTGKAVAREDGDVVAAVAFNEDRTDPDALWLRYVTVDRERRGEGIGPTLVALVRERAFDREYERVRIAVNNPYAYEACWRAGFGYTGETTGIAELVLECDRPADDRPGCEHPDATGDRETPRDHRRPERYREGLDSFRERDLTDDERSFVASRIDRGPPTERVRKPSAETVRKPSAETDQNPSAETDR